MSTGASSDIPGMLDRLRRGDPTARQALMCRAHHRLVKIAASALEREFPGVRGRHDLESVVSETWLGMMRALETIHPETEAGFFGLVYLKARHALFQIARRQRRYDAHRVNGSIDSHGRGSLATDDFPDTTNDPRRLAILTELHRQIELLPELEKSVFWLHYYGGYTQLETAQVVGLHPKQVSRIWLQATNRLAKWLKDADGLL